MTDEGFEIPEEPEKPDYGDSASEVYRAMGVSQPLERDPWEEESLRPRDIRGRFARKY